MCFSHKKEKKRKAKIYKAIWQNAYVIIDGQIGRGRAERECVCVCLRQPRLLAKDDGNSRTHSACHFMGRNKNTIAAHLKLINRRGQRQEWE